MKISLKLIGLFLGPILFGIGLFFQHSEYLNPTAWQVLAVASWMVIWWITEAAPMAVTALLPIILFPALGVFTLKVATAPYASPIIFLFMGGFLLALGLEEHGLHKRIALRLIKLTGTSANGIILGFMMATAFLSMWISNTATTIMMLPIAISVIQLVKHDSLNEKGFNNFALALMLGIAYSANVGGLATIIGTPPNVVFVGYAEELLHIEIGFADWMMVGVPISAILLTVTFILLTQVLHKNKLGKMSNAEELITKELDALGKWKREEKIVAVIFGLTAFMWIFKAPLNNLIGFAMLNDTVTAMIGGITMFVVPISIKEKKQLLHWKATERLPWGILLLFGGGMALAKAMEHAGLVAIIAAIIAQNQFSTLLIFLILITVMLFMTELMSNVALTTIFIPIVIAIAEGANINPLLLSIPVAMAASCAFMMPISTPPNAIVFSSGHIKISQMVRVGIWLNIFSVLVLLVAAFSLVQWVFG
ncbi:MAG: DASS family sodium-coupled anion symporter [Cyclobacteriaceae bacterium]|nr:DASS family sodium-coupled anion symporter [Cyclobacteriaceae bacterium]